MYLNRFNSISAVLLYLYFLYSYAKQFAKEHNEKNKFKIYIGLYGFKIKGTADATYLCNTNTLK